jgi:hypothetical protein
MATLTRTHRRSTGSIRASGAGRRFAKLDYVVNVPTKTYDKMIAEAPAPSDALVQLFRDRKATLSR